MVVVFVCLYLLTYNSYANTVVDSELSRAVGIGLITADDLEQSDKPITYSALSIMIKNMLGTIDENYAKSWEKVAHMALKSNKFVTRQEGMLSLFYAAEIMGCIQDDSDWLKMHMKISDCWDELTWEYNEFPDWQRKALYEKEWDNSMIAAYFFCLGQQSPMIGNLLFDYDASSNSMRLKDKLTTDEAIRAVLRLYECNVVPLDSLTIMQETEWLHKANARIEEIKNSKNTSIKYSGRAYYVSNEGKDSNNGRSKNKPWATLDKVNKVKLRKGDAIFFERGSLFRGYLKCQEGVLYSAYGQGEKPKIYGSIENGAYAKKWTKVPGTDNIWRYYKDIGDCGTIVFNDGESCATKERVYWNGKAYISTKDYKTKFNIKDLEELSFFNELKLKGHSVPIYLYDKRIKGKLYLRCDKGNPGKVYKSIEFLTNDHKSLSLVSGAKGCVVDNLCVKYGDNCGIELIEDSVAQNCEVAWVGGFVLSYNKIEEDNYNNAITYAGDGIVIGGVNNTAINNYIHDVYDYGMTVETGYRDAFNIDIMENLEFTNNVISYCNGGAVIINWEREADENHRFRNIQLKENHILFSGYGWSYKRHIELDSEYMANAIMFFDVPNVNDGIYIKDNVLYLAKYALIYHGMIKDNTPILDGNTYVQDKYGLIIRGPNKYSRSIISILADKNTINSFLKDKNAVIHNLKYIDTNDKK